MSLVIEIQRSRHLGPEGKASPGQLQNSTSNLTSDLYFQRIKDDRVVERLFEQPAPDGPEPEVEEAIRGYVQGYNRYLAEAGATTSPTRPVAVPPGFGRSRSWTSTGTRTPRSSWAAPTRCWMVR
ncbi:penicillin acylase family protein [Streptomyces sp. NPDC002911]